MLKYLVIIFYLINSINCYINNIKIIKNNKYININNNLNKKNNINFIVWKGYGIPLKNYINFSKLLINKGIEKNININVTLCDENIIPVKNNIILFGHSSGGYHVHKYDKNNIISKITYGTSPKNYYDNTIFEIKTKNKFKSLNIIGKYDGFISYNNLFDQIIYNNKNNITNNDLIITETNHLCIADNKATLISKILCLNDFKKKENYTIMQENIIRTVIDYIENKNELYNYNNTKKLLNRNTIYKIKDYKHFIKSKPDKYKTYIYIDKKYKRTYIKTKGYIGDLLLKKYKNNKKVLTTLEWLYSNEKKILVFVFKKLNYIYIRIPYIVNNIL